MALRRKGPRPRSTTSKSRRSISLLTLAHVRHARTVLRGSAYVRSPNPERLDTVRVLAWALLILLATLLPFDFGAGGPTSDVLETSGHEYLRGLDVVLNVLLFAPLGMLLVLWLRPRVESWGLTSLIVGTTAFTLSISIEVIQQWLPSRTSSFADVVSNTAGAVIGAIAYRAFGPSAIPRLQRFRRETSRPGRLTIFAALSVLILLLSGLLQNRARLTGWDPSFFLLIGNEHTGDRPWRGRVFSIELSDTAASEEELRNFAAGIPPDLRDGSIAAFRFVSRGHIEDAAGNLPPLIWMGSRQHRESAGLTVTAQGWIESAEPPAEITRRIEASGQFTLHLVCASDDVQQEGPARILSYSIDPMQRNFMVGQEGEDLVFRLRTPATDPNGTRIPLVLPGVFSSTANRDILITYSGSTLRAAVAGSNQSHTLEINPGLSLASYYLFLTPGDFVFYKLAYYAFVFSLLGGVLAFFERSAFPFFAVGLPGLAAFSFLLESTLAFAGLRAFQWSNFGMSLAVGLAVLVALAVATGATAMTTERRAHAG